MNSTLRSHIEEKMRSAELLHFPFPHMIIEGFFPDDVFRKILEKNPFKQNAGREWLTESETKHLKTATPYFARKQINFHRNDPFEATSEDASFWNDIKLCFLADHWFEKLVVEKYREYFILRFGEYVDDEEFFASFHKELFLQRHEPGYYIGPHTDIPTRVFTCIFSFADREGFEQYGTQLCVHKNKRVRCWGNDHYVPDDFIVRKVAPYKPNNFLLFFKTRHSFHSVKAIDDSVPNQRYGMQFQFYEPSQGVFTDLSAPDLLTMKHRKQSKLREILSVLQR